jgi:hypothetical protein
MSRARRKTQRAKPKAELKPQPKWWRQAATWIIAHFAAGYMIATVALGALFLVTASLGTVTNDDIAAAAVLQASFHKQAIFYHRDPTQKEAFPAIFYLPKTGAPKLVCETVSGGDVLKSSSIRVSNRFGKSMQSVINATEWVLGFFYEIKFPTTLLATAKEVRDPNFGQGLLNLHSDLLEVASFALYNKSCAAAVGDLLKSKDALVCQTHWFIRSPDQRQLLVVGVAPFCIIPSSAPEGLKASSDDLESSFRYQMPFFTKIKFYLGLVHAEVDREPRP